MDHLIVNMPDGTCLKILLKNIYATRLRLNTRIMAYQVSLYFLGTWCTVYSVASEVEAAKQIAQGIQAQYDHMIGMEKIGFECDHVEETL